MSSQVYTPGLKIKEFCLVRKRRILPLKGEVLVRNGDTVSCDTIIARTTVPGKTHLVNVAYILGIDPEEISHSILKKIGDFVEKGELLAHYRAFFGLVNKKCLSPVTGIIEDISNITGQITLREQPVPISVKAYIPGIVEEVIPYEGAVIRTPAAFIQGIFGVGGENNGEVIIISKDPKNIVDVPQITTDCDGKVLICGALITSGALRKAVEVGAKGVVVGGIRGKDLNDFIGYEIGVAITGHEELGLTLIITEGFGKVPMRHSTFNIFRKLEGRLACINGATQIRAGVIRPEIIIPYPSSKIEEFEEESYNKELKVGTTVRIIRDPFFGAVGKVVGLPIELQKIETESMVRVLEVKLEDGKKVIIPRANVETIEET
jgi:hypothetical protein